MSARVEPEPEPAAADANPVDAGADDTPVAADAGPDLHGPGGEAEPGPRLAGTPAPAAADVQAGGRPQLARRLTTHAPAGLRRQNQPRPDIMMDAHDLIVTHPNVMLFMPTITTRTWDILKPTFRPLAGGAFIVDGIPISYALQGEAAAQSYAGMTFGPGMLEEIRVFVTGVEADRLRLIQVGKALGPEGLPIIIGARGWDNEPEGRFGGDAMLRFGAGAFAGTNAHAELSASLGVFGNALSATAFAGMTAGAKANAHTDVNTYVTVSYDDGRIRLSATVEMHAGFELAFKLAAYAGVRVELRLPEIPGVTALYREVQDWPIVGWVMPDITRWNWRREYRKEWPLLEQQYRWDVRQQFTVGDGTASGALPEPQGFDMQTVLRDAQARQHDGDLKDDPAGPGQGRRDGDPAAVSAAKSAALAQISSAKRAAEREKAANERMLTRARVAAAGTHVSAAGTGSAPPAAASVTGSGGGTPVQDLEARGQKLDQAEKATDQLRERADALNAPATAPDGASRNEAQSGYDAVAVNANALGDKINRGEEGFAIPPSAEPADADYQRMVAAMHVAYDAFDTAFDPTRTEKLYADDQVRASGSDPDLQAYRNAALLYQQRSGDLWRRVQKLEEDLERAREWYERYDHAHGAVVFGELEQRARAIATEAVTLAGGRPVGDWDLTYVELSGGHLMLKPQYRAKQTRSYFYPHDYSPATRNRMLAEIGSFRAQDGLVYWEFRGRPSPRGDHWWLMDDASEGPSLDHTQPTVVAHWNGPGRTTAYGDRQRFYDFLGAPLVVVPKVMNSTAGGAEPSSYTPQVTRGFRGAKT